MLDWLRHPKPFPAPADVSKPSVEPWRRIIEYWKGSGIVIRPGVSMAEVESFQLKYGVAVPADLLEYLLAVDGEARATAVTVHGAVDSNGRPSRMPGFLAALIGPGV